MTVDEAIICLSDMKIKVAIPKAAVTQIKRNLALDMAINALNCSEIPNNSDTISRQAAIDKITKRLFETAFNNVGIKQDIDETLVDVAENRLETWFDEQPTIEPEQRWIPCSERLPNKFEDVWVTDNCGRVAVCRMGHTGWRDMESDEWMYHLDSIVAWMPYNAPEPYQEGGKQNGTEK